VGCGRNTYSCIGLQRVLLKDLEHYPSMRRLGIGSEGVAKYGDGVIVGEDVWFKEAGTWDIIEEELVD
jgi:hypothetical protein